MIALRNRLKDYVITQILTCDRQTMVRRLIKLVKDWGEKQPADEQLRFLFELDAALYGLQGRASKDYEGGQHAKHRLIRYHDFFVDRLVQGEKVLDVGCGNGTLAYAMAERAGVSVFGIDIKEKNIKDARAANRHTNIRFVVGDALKALPEENFDVVVLSNVLEHLPDRSQFLSRLIAATKASRYLLRVPQFERDWRVPLKKELNVEWRLDKTHETEYSSEQFVSELAEAGLEITEQLFCWGEIWAVAETV